jgi:hypothetical protein
LEQRRAIAVQQGIGVAAGGRGYLGTPAPENKV